jgi:hypothetical protein
MIMQSTNRLSLIWLIVFFLVGQAVTGAQAQEAGPSHIFITGSSADSAPTIDLYAYGLDSQGNVIDLAAVDLVVQHGEQAIEDVSSGGIYEGATFVIFVLDVTPGTARHAGAIQQAVEQYAAPPYMVETQDYIAIYRVDEAAAAPLLEADTFYNSVRNTFATPLPAHTGPTALYDSVMGLLNNLEALKPSTGLAPAMVIVTDGTDEVSSQFRAADVPARAAALGVPIHTIWLDNERFQQALKNQGQEYLGQVALGTGGLTAALENPEQLEGVWSRITALRQQSVVRYTVPDLGGGDYPVVLSLRANPAIQDQTTVSVPAGAPSVVINLPPESRNLTLANLDDPVDLSFSTNVTWLDGVERSLTRAQLLVNGVIVQEVDPGRVNRFNARINNFRFGENRVQISVVDDQGNRATSPDIVLTIDQGTTTEIPAEVQPVGRIEQFRTGSNRLWPALAGCFGVTFLLVLLIGSAWAVRRFRILQKLRLTSLARRIPFLRPYMREAAQVQQIGHRAQRMRGQAGRFSPHVRGQRQGQPAAAAGRAPAFLEIVESVSRMPVPRVELGSVEVRLGRSPAQSEIAFENDITVSRIHSSIVQEGEEYRIYDEQSTSGTWVNEQRVPDYGLQLVDGDEIRLGAVRLRFRQP